MRPNQQEIMEPGRALTGLLFALAFGAFWWWLARQPGWEIAWLGVVASAGLVLEAWRRLVLAHRADKERERNERISRELSDIYTTGGKWEPTQPRGKRDRGWPSG